MTAREENREGLLSFVCKVGHGFSGESLVRSKEDQLEYVLWSAVETFHEIAVLHEEMAARARDRRAPDLARAYRRRSQRAVTLGAELRQIISRDGPALVGNRRT
ncbi:MAG TPA: hypothetical protein VHO06_24075 [Polyangia bacterium]|nr:hypothetical protein [Polyangia bacterium]